VWQGARQSLTAPHTRRHDGRRARSKAGLRLRQVPPQREPIINIALRAKKLDEIALKFVVRHPDAVALDLGVGLDARMFRIAAPFTVDWYAIDFPEVITARQ
jgi:O-methyltransferase involved in polyketide biosynthesis